MTKWLSALAMAFALLSAAPVFADDWTAAKLRGAVLAGDPSTDTWSRLARGDVVPDTRVIRTMASGNAEFQRGNETVAFGPNTQAEIIDRRGAKPFTTVVQQFGAVTISADVRQVQHFAVSTPYLVAVVKGTQFTVLTGPAGSTVSVHRGLVAVTGTSDHKTINVAAGQSVAAAANGALVLSGKADAALTHPVVNGVVEDSDTASDDGTGVLGGDGLGLGDTVSGVTGTLGDTISCIGGVAAGLTTGLGNTVGGQLGGGLGGTVSGVTGTVGSTVGNTTSTVGGTVGSVGGTVGGVLHHLGL